MDKQDGTRPDERELRPLVARARAGDRWAFGELYVRLSPRVCSYFRYALNGDAQPAEDLTEEVFIRVLERLDRYEERGLPFSAWVFRVAHNHLIDHARARPARPIVPLEACGDLPEPGADRALELVPTRVDLARVLPRLTEDQRHAILLGFFRGLSTAETASAMDKTEDAVKKLRVRGLRALRRHLTGARGAAVGPAAGGVRWGA